MLLASTFVGGSNNDGQNFIGVNAGDSWRGEIFIDNAGSVYIASGTLSADFPVTAGAYCTTINGGEDAVIFKMNASLSSMTWATYLGGSLHDFATGIRTDDAGYAYVCGTFRGIFGDFPSVPGSYQSAYLGGASDGFIAKFDPSGSNLVACTYVGGPGVDLAYFIDLDTDGDVYVCGEARLGTVITSGVYANPGSTNFIAKFNAELNALLFSTLIGDGTANHTVIPSAFMVDNCKRIFLAGFGGSQAWPLTSDALYTTWDAHHQWYLTCLSENAASLLFGSLFGSWHVDGGTSRFDKKGVVYQAVCADSTEFPATPWAYADGTNVLLWDICVFKIDFEMERDTLLLPNVFTPNGDGINDVYEVGLRTANFYELKIFDRWGKMVFSTNDLNTNWDGTYGGRDCEEGVYYVSVKHGYCDDEPYVNTGFLHLQRSR
jgi:gliding motility-associated-like protein